LGYTVVKRATMNIDYNLLKTFSKLSELGSFTAAAKVLNQPKSTVSRAISRLESELGVELVRRTTRKTSLTSEGEKLYKNITPYLEGIRNELIRVSDKKDEMTGTIRITTSDSFAQNTLAQIISIYSSKYPKVKIEMIITNDYLDLVKENIDIAFRAGKLKDSTLIQKKFMATSFIFVCSKGYIDKYSAPNCLDEIQNHKFLSFKPIEKVFTDKGVVLNPVVLTDSLPMLLKLALNGDGVTVLPDFLCQKYLASKELVRVISTWKSKSENLHVLYPPTKNQPRKVKEFIEVGRSMFL
jgi:LysR family transcriptional regulator for bpeEF and oprC